MWALLLPLAFATDTWTTPHSGLRLLARDTAEIEAWALEIDLCARGVSIEATEEDQRERTTSSFRSLLGAQAAINGDFFSYADYMPTGWAVADGVAWADDSAERGSVVFGSDGALVLDPTELWTSPLDWMQEGVSGYPLLVEGGELTDMSPGPSHCDDLNPRTAVGLSRDRQTAWFVVVDGRSSASEGMVCTDLGSFLIELGAWTALNLDGGGSSTLVIEDLGTVNNPSDGSERVVSNHLAVHADGEGAPGSCDFYLDEVVLDAAMADPEQDTDFDGDGDADWCARASAGWRCIRSDAGAVGDTVSMTNLSDSSGWDDELYHSSIRMGDVTGDGRADVCGRGSAGLYCWASNGDSWSDSFRGPEWSNAAGYDSLAQASTLRLADLDGDGDEDACIRGPEGIRCALSEGSSFGDEFAGPSWSDASGWHQPQFFGTIQLGDWTGDGRADLCGRGSAGMFCAAYNGAGFDERIEGPAWTDALGWDEVKYWSSIRLQDIDGDGRADLCGRGPAGVECHLSDGAGFPTAVSPGLWPDSSGWGDHDNASTLRWGDIDADGDLDLCARANAYVSCYPWTGAGFGDRVAGPEWSDSAGYDDFRHYSTLRLGDLNGDRRADLCARGPDGVECYLSDGAAFPTAVEGPNWTDSSGWAARDYFSTLRLGSRDCRPELTNGRDDDCDGEIDEHLPPDSGGGGDGASADSGSDGETDGGEEGSDGATEPGGAPDSGADPAEEGKGSRLSQPEAGCSTVPLAPVAWPAAFLLLLRRRGRWRVGG